MKSQAAINQAYADGKSEAMREAFREMLAMRRCLQEARNWITQQIDAIDPVGGGNDNCGHAQGRAILMQMESVFAPEPNGESAAMQSVLATLNEALDLDRAAISALMFTRTSCNRALTDHPTIQTGEKDVGPMGLINGFIKPLFGDQIMFVCDDSAPETILKFEIHR